MSSENYTEIQRVLTEERSLADAAEAHGTLAGCLCAAIGYRFEDWLLEILPEGHADPLARETLRELYVDTAGSLEGREMEFELLLPVDEAAYRCTHGGAGAVVSGLSVRTRNERRPGRVRAAG